MLSVQLNWQHAGVRLCTAPCSIKLNVKLQTLRGIGHLPIMQVVLQLPHVKLLHGLRQGCIPVTLASAIYLQVLPDVSTWDYKGQDEVRNQHCNLWELQQRYVHLTL